MPPLEMAFPVERSRRLALWLVTTVVIVPIAGMVYEHRAIDAVLDTIDRAGR